MRAAPRAGRRDRSDLHRRLETRLQPRYGESAVQVSGIKPMRLIDARIIGDSLAFLTYKFARDA